MHFELSPMESYHQYHIKDLVRWESFSENIWIKAQEEQKPVLLSFGYKGSLGCEKMHKECFQVPFIADLMNRHFICVLVDREEFPILDSTALEVSYMVSQSSGWPIQIFCLPDGRPFMAGNDFPPQDLGDGRIPWPQFLMRIYNHFKQDQKGLAENANGIVQNLVYFNNPPALEEVDQAPLAQNHRQAIELLLKHADQVHGGWKGEVKFPCAMLLEVLDSAIERYPDLSKEISELFIKTLDAMAKGALWDEANGGFWRYTRKNWQDPYLEKSAAENVLLLRAYENGLRRFKNPLYFDIISRTVEWLMSEFNNLNSQVSDIKMFRTKVLWGSTLLRLDFLTKEAKEGEAILQDAIAKVLHEGSEKKFTLTDFVYALEGAIFLAEKQSSEHLKRAVELIFEKIVKNFKDPEGLGFFETIVGNQDWCVRRKIWMDTTLPTGQTLLVKCLTSSFLNPQYISDLLKVYLPMWQKIPQATSYTLMNQIR